MQESQSAGTGPQCAYIVDEKGQPSAYMPDSSFAFNHGLKYIALPKSIKVIGRMCFYDSNGLEYIKMYDNVGTIESEAFANAVSLLDFTLPANLDMTEGCLKTYAGANSDIVCRCVSEIVSENFSDKELKYYRRFQKEQPWTLEEQNIASSLRAKIQKFASLDVYLTKQEFQQFGETLQNCILQKQ